MVQQIITAPANGTRRGTVKLTADLAGTADAPLLNPGGTVPKHAHRRVLEPVSPILHTNNIGLNPTVYPAYNGGGHTVWNIMLNNSATITLSATPPGGPIASDPLFLRPPGALNAGSSVDADTGFYGANSSQGPEYGHRLVLNLFQDDTGGWTPTLAAAETSIAFAPTLGSGTAHQVRTVVLEWLGPYVGWIVLYTSAAWAASPYASYFANSNTASSGQSGKFLRGLVVGGATQTQGKNTLDTVSAGTTLNYRKACYYAGMWLVTGPNVGTALTNPLTGYSDVSSQGYTDTTLKSAPACLIHANAAGNTYVHETGHVVDLIVAPRLNLVGGNGTLKDDPALTAFWQQDYNDALAYFNGQGVTLAQLIATPSSYGNAWTNEQWYTTGTLGEWIAQTVAGWVQVKNGVSGAATNVLGQSVNPTRHSAVIARLDALLSSLI